jgi:3-phenylpropionate/trans-cinnamate dioxygenase ferredoxin reductase subunit
LEGQRVIASDVQNIVVVGGGMAGIRVAQGLRSRGFDGRLLLLSDEVHLPYDRPPLSKEFLTNEAAPAVPALVTAAELTELNIDIVHTKATGLDADGHRVLAGHLSYSYDRAVIATGAAARRLRTADGGAAPAVLRTLNDAMALRTSLAGARSIAVIGGGLIGCEVAATSRSLGLDVSIVEPAPSLMMRSFGEKLGGYLQDMHVARGVRVLTGVGVATVTKRGDPVGGGSWTIHLTSGEIIDSDALMTGVGAEANVGWLRDSGLVVEDGVLCDRTLTTSDSDVMVAGDVAKVLNATGEYVRYEQWLNAVDQAQHIAENLLLPHAERSPYTNAGYFWTQQYDVRAQGIGAHHDADLVLEAHDPLTHTFLAKAVRDGTVVGMFAAGFVREFAVERRKLGL